MPAVADPPLGGTDAVFRALVHGDVDLYPDYTGTISHQILHDPSLVADDQLRAGLAARGIGMTDSIGFDDTYAIGMTEARAAALRRSARSATSPATPSCTWGSAPSSPTAPTAGPASAPPTACRSCPSKRSTTSSPTAACSTARST